MENENKPEEPKPVEEPKEEPKLNMVERAEVAAKSMTEQTDRMEALVKRNEDAAAKAMLGGGTTGGQTPEPPKVETPKDYTEKVMRGDLNDKKN